MKNQSAVSGLKIPKGINQEQFLERDKNLSEIENSHLALHRLWFRFDNKFFSNLEIDESAGLYKVVYERIVHDYVFGRSFAYAEYPCDLFDFTNREDAMNEVKVAILRLQDVFSDFGFVIRLSQGSPERFIFRIDFASKLWFRGG